VGSLTALASVGRRRLIGSNIVAGSPISPAWVLPSYAAVALQRIAWAAAFVVGFPKVQRCFGLITANVGDFEGVADLQRQLAASLGNSKGFDCHARRLLNKPKEKLS
jgi:hypothetical protein